MFVVGRESLKELWPDLVFTVACGLLDKVVM